jgi:hypothetical protein
VALEVEDERTLGLGHHRLTGSDPHARIGGQVARPAPSMFTARPQSRAVTRAAVEAAVTDAGPLS